MTKLGTTFVDRCGWRGRRTTFRWLTRSQESPLEEWRQKCVLSFFLSPPPPPSLSPFCFLLLFFFLFVSFGITHIDMHWKTTTKKFFSCFVVVVVYCFLGGRGEGEGRGCFVRSKTHNVCFLIIRHKTMSNLAQTFLSLIFYLFCMF